MNLQLLVDADRVVASLSPGRRESVREIIVETVTRGVLSVGARTFLDRTTGSSLVADVLAAAMEEYDPAASPLTIGGQPG